jgi:transcriptional regulator with XRE-family HTH domain
MSIDFSMTAKKGLTLGELLDQLRADRNMDGKTLAEKAGLSTAYVSLLIRGERRAPSEEVLAALATALKLNVEERKQLTQAAIESESSESTSKLSKKQKARKPLDERVEASAAGIEGVHPYLSESLLYERIVNAHALIRIQDTWLPDPRSYRASFAEAFARNKALRVEILLLKPESVFAKLRATDLKARTEHYVSEQILDALFEFQTLADSGFDIEVRTYESSPSIQQIVCDDQALVGFFLHGERSDLAPQLDVQIKDSLLGEFLRDEFEYVWQTAQPVVPGKPSEG